MRKCEAIKNGLFCVEIEGAKNVLFNKSVSEERFFEVYRQVKSYNWNPDFANWYDIKGNKEWWAFCFPQLENVDNDVAWSKISHKMLEYIKSLPEFDPVVWDKLTER